MGAVFAGGLASAALTLVLLSLGAGLGLAVVSPWSDWNVTAVRVATGAGIFTLLVAVMASAVGGYLAGRLRTRWSGVHGDEVYFRDTAHGLLAWAFATVVSVGITGAAATQIVAGAASGAAPAAAVARVTAGPLAPSMSTSISSCVRPLPRRPMRRPVRRCRLVARPPIAPRSAVSSCGPIAAAPTSRRPTAPTLRS